MALRQLATDWIAPDHVQVRKNVMASKAKLVEVDHRLDIMSGIAAQLAHELHGVKNVRVHLNCERTGGQVLELAVCEIASKDVAPSIICACKYIEAREGKVHAMSIRALVAAQVSADAGDYSLVVCVGGEDASSAAKRIAGIVRDYAARHRWIGGTIPMPEGMAEYDPMMVSVWPDMTDAEREDACRMFVEGKL